MSLAAVETALAEFVGDVLVNDCGRPVPDRVLRYHGTLPHDCCTEDGFLVVSWNVLTPQGGTDQCAGWPQAELRVRYVVCWPTVDVSPSGVEIDDAGWDEQAAMLADVAHCVTVALMSVTCDDDPFATTLMATTVNRQLRLVATEPITPQGGCAGVQWRLTYALRGYEASAS
jgi:hypothetical protein